MARKPNSTDQFFAEVVSYGGIPLTRFDLLKIMQEDGFERDCIHFFVYAPKVIDAEPKSYADYRALEAEREASDAARKAEEPEESAKAAPEPTKAQVVATEIKHPDYHLRPARYAKKMVAITCISDGSIFPGRAMRLAGTLSNERYTGRERAFILSPSKARKFVDLYEAGWDASFITGELLPPRRCAEAA